MRFPHTARGLVICASWLATLPATAEPAPSGQVAATVNGDAITVDEFRDALQRTRSHATDEPAARAAALEDCVRTKIVLQLARRHGLTLVTSDSDLRQTHAAENARRAAAHARGEPIYGPRQLTWPAFRLRWLDGIERDLQRAIVASTPPPSPAELEVFYAAHRALFAPQGKAEPLPFADIRDHVRRLWDEKIYRAAVAAARAGATIALERDL